MNDDVQIKLIDMIMGWPPVAQIFGFIVFLFALAFFLFPGFRNSVSDGIYYLLRISNDNPIKHPFFLQKTLLLLQIDKISFPDKDKTWLFLTLMRIKMEIAFSLVHEFVKSKVWKKMNKYELQAALLLLVKNIVDTYDLRIEQAYINKYKSFGSRLFNLVYHSEFGFKNYHQRNIDNIQHNITKVFLVSSFNNAEIMNFFILQIWVALGTAINDCVASFKGLNGNLTSVIKEYYAELQAEPVL